MRLEAVDAQTYSAWVDGWELLLPQRPGLTFLQDAGTPFRVTYLASERTAYVRYNVVRDHSLDDWLWLRQRRPDEQADVPRWTGCQ